MRGPRPTLTRPSVAAATWVCLWVIGGAATAHRTQGAMAELVRVGSLDLWSITGFTREGRDLQLVLRVPGAEGRLSRLLDVGSPAARVFAACGLYDIGSDRFPAARKRLADDRSDVEFGGCFPTSKPIRELVADLPRLCPHMKLDLWPWVISEVGWIARR